MVGERLEKSILAVGLAAQFLENLRPVLVGPLQEAGEMVSLI